MRQLYSCFLTGIVALLFLAGCSDTPPTIVFDQPEGKVIDTSNPAEMDQVITGTVVKGTNPVTKLVVLNKNGYVLEDLVATGNYTVGGDGSFTYTYTLPDTDTDLFSICTFEATAGLITNQERMVFIRGEEEGNRGVAEQGVTLDNAVNVKLNEDLVNVVVGAAQRVINNSLQDIIDDANMFPMGQSDSLVVAGITLASYTAALTSVTMSDFSIDKNDEVDPDVEINDEQEIKANKISIDQISLNGYFDLTVFGLYTHWPFVIDVNNVTLDQLKMWAFRTVSTNNINVRFDVDDLDAAFWSQLDIDLTIAGWSTDNDVLDFLESAMMQLFGAFFRLLFDTIAIPIVDINDLAMTIDTGSMNTYGIPIDLSLDIGAWFPLEIPVTGNPDRIWIYETNSYGEMGMQLGLSVEPTTPVLIPVGHYYSTPGDLLPDPMDLSFDSAFDHNNLIVSLNDDMINMGAQAAVDAGLLDGLNVTAAFKYLAGDVFANSLFRNARVLVYMKTPPIADFSCPGGDCSYTYDEGTDVTSCYAGKFIVRDMVIIIDNLIAGNIIDTVRVSADTDVGINLQLVNGGTRIEGSMAGSSYLDVAYLYVQNANMTALAGLAPEIVNYVMGQVLKALIKIDVPVVDMYDANVQPYIYATEVGDNNLTTWLGASDEGETP